MDDALTPFDARCIQWRGSVDVIVCILFFCPIDDFTVLVGRVFRLYWVRVTESGANIRDV